MTARGSKTPPQDLVRAFGSDLFPLALDERW
jgi:hypothetical protein